MLHSESDNDGARGPERAETISRVAQYVRMSTDTQDCSIAYQRAHNERYAVEKGYEIIRTFVDEGVSGIGIERREGLQKLISTACDGTADFEAVLVFDISRWGRFQNPDESAYYEFMCASSGISVEYTADPLLNEGTLTAILVKSIKRVMAAEYSRELSMRQSACQRALVTRGLWTNGPAPYGYTRCRVSPSGELGPLLTCGQRVIAMRGYHSVLRPGAAGEVANVQRIFRLAARGVSPKEIAAALNADGMFYRDGRAWRSASVSHLIKNEIYTGTCVRGRTRWFLGRVTREPTEAHRRIDGFTEPLITRALFARAQRARSRRARPQHTRRSLLEGLKTTLAKEGRLSGSIIARSPDCASTHAFQQAFGSLSAAYREIGYVSPHAYVHEGRRLAAAAERRSRITDEELLQEIRKAFAAHGQLSTSLINHLPELHSAELYRKRFGGMRRVYALAGFQPSGMQAGTLNRPGQTLTAAEAEALRRSIVRDEPDDPPAREAGPGRHSFGT